MRVTVYFNSSYPYGAASTNRVHQLCKGLHNNGVEVELVITNATERRPETLNSQIIGTFEEIKFKYISKTTLRPKGLIQRKAKDLHCYLRTYKHLLFSTRLSDAIVVIGGASFDFRVLIPFLGRITRKDVFLEINEYPFVTRKENHWKCFILFFFFRIVVPAYKGFIVISEALELEINKYRNKDSRIIKIPILSEPSNYAKSFSLPPDPVPYLLHAGSLIEQKDGILGSLKAFAKARNRLGYEIHYILSGDLRTSPNGNEIEKIIRDENLINSVVFTGYLDKNKLADYYSHASVAVINKSLNKQNEYGFATKISEYITYKIPLVLTPVGEVKNYFKDGYNALFVEPDNVEQIADALVCLLNDHMKAGFLANNAMHLLETEFNTSFNGAKLKTFFENCL